LLRAARRLPLAEQPREERRRRLRAVLARPLRGLLVVVLVRGGALGRLLFVVGVGVGGLPVRGRRLLARTPARRPLGAVLLVVLVGITPDPERDVERGVELRPGGGRALVLLVVVVFFVVGGALRAALRRAARRRGAAPPPRQRRQQPAARVEPAQRRLGRSGVEQVGVEDEGQQEEHRERDAAAQHAESAVVLQQRREGDAEVAARIGDPDAAPAEEVGEHRRQRRAEEQDPDRAQPDGPPLRGAQLPPPLSEQRERDQEGGIAEVREEEARRDEADGATDVVPAGRAVAGVAAHGVEADVLAVRRHRAEQEEAGAEPRDGGESTRTVALH